MSKNVVGNLILVFVAFPLETFKITNPRIKAFGYDPYLWKLFLEEYDHKGMEEEGKGIRGYWRVRLGFHFLRIRLMLEFKLLVLFFLLAEKPLLTLLRRRLRLGIWLVGGEQFGGKSDGSCCGCDNGDTKGLEEDYGGEYPMDYCAQDGGEWNSSYVKKATRPVRRNVLSSIGDVAAT
ncbi:hypothetical protein POTOM_044267 [Populus tomentosa]|uniref:Uncharacterized protein n=1 Tax=Populus tomentosa TaxID=118781 RepID=A0A8X7YJQ6_POPTO|nr:hypothetical protein POTOM_044267 [Populus tomentosa]